MVPKAAGRLLLLRSILEFPTLLNRVLSSSSHRPDKPFLRELTKLLAMSFHASKIIDIEPVHLFDKPDCKTKAYSNSARNDNKEKTNMTRASSPNESRLNFHHQRIPCKTNKKRRDLRRWLPMLRDRGNLLDLKG